MILDLEGRKIVEPGARRLQQQKRLDRKNYFDDRERCRVERDVAAFAQEFRIEPETIQGCQGLDARGCWRRFRDFDDFFTRRRLRLPEPIPYHPRSAAARRVVSPVDAYALCLGRGQLLRLKDQEYRIGMPGAILALRLSPCHYHRIHSPCMGFVTSIRSAGYGYSGTYLMDYGVGVLSRNYRVIMTLRMIDGTDLVMTAVGARCVGSIEITHPRILTAFREEYPSLPWQEVLNRRLEVRFRRPPTVGLTDELGRFRLGGSMVVLTVPTAIEPSIVLDTIRRHTLADAETSVSVGQPLFSVLSAAVQKFSGF
ncbi:hypothetical protein EBZ80_13660 [bacterium]|nr:hypothetical protein [bacterium]